MKLLAPALLLIAFCNCLTVQAAPTPAQMEDVREAVFRVLMVRAKMVMPEAKVYILEKEGPHPPQWGSTSGFEPSANLLARFAGNFPHIVPVSQAGGGASPEGVWREDKNHAHGPLLQIVSIQWLNGTTSEVETDVEGETNTGSGIPWNAVSRPYTATLVNGNWTVQEDVRKEWQQAVREGDIREAVVRRELADGVYGAKPETTPCYLSFGLFSAGPKADPGETFMKRFALSSIRLQRASQRPQPKSREPYILIGVEHVRWVSDSEAEVDGSSTRNNFMSANSVLYDVTRAKNGWNVQPIFALSI